MHNTSQIVVALYAAGLILLSGPVSAHDTGMWIIYEATLFGLFFTFPKNVDKKSPCKMGCIVSIIIVALYILARLTTNIAEFEEAGL